MALLAWDASHQMQQRDETGKKKQCWLPLSVEAGLPTAVCQIVCTTLLCFHSSLSPGVEDSARAWHHSFSGANRANLQHHREWRYIFSCTLWFMMTRQVYVSIRLLASAALRGCCTMLGVGRQIVMAIKERFKSDGYSDMWRDRKVLSPFPENVIPGEALSAGWSSNQPSQWDNYIS